MPGSFIPIFEKYGFISKLDHYVWEETCRYLRERRERGLAEIAISVNISRLSLYDQNLCADLLAMVERYGIKPSLLKLEITEGVYTDTPDRMIAAIAKLRRSGFVVMMDDFGSGYSSLNMLKDVAVDVLKMDMRFIEGFEKSKRAGNILVSVLRMAKWLELPVIAEGVETAA